MSKKVLVPAQIDDNVDLANELGGGIEGYVLLAEIPDDMVARVRRAAEMIAGHSGDVVDAAIVPADSEEVFFEVPDEEAFAPRSFGVEDDPVDAATLGSARGCLEFIATTPVGIEDYRVEVSSQRVTFRERLDYDWGGGEGTLHLVATVPTSFFLDDAPDADVYVGGYGEMPEMPGISEADPDDIRAAVREHFEHAAPSMG